MDTLLEVQSLDRFLLEDILKREALLEQLYDPLRDLMVTLGRENSVHLSYMST